MQFLEYMLRSGRLQPVSCRKYAGALYGTLSRMAEMPLSEIESAHEFEQIAEGLKQLDAFSQLNKTSNHMYSSALKWKPKSRRKTPRNPVRSRSFKLKVRETHGLFIDSNSAPII